MKQAIKEINYVCEPESLQITAKYALFNESGARGAGIKISVYENGTFVFHKNVPSKRNFFKREDYNIIIKRLLNNIFNMERDEYQKHILKNEIKGLFFYDNLLLVRNKLGNIIYKR